MERPNEPTRDSREPELSDAEAALLRRFVRRHALGGLAGRSVATAALLALGLALWPGRIAAPPAREGADPALAATALRAELDGIRAQLAERRPAALPAATSAASPDAAELARRIDALAREITSLRARPQTPASPLPPAQTPPPPAPAAGLAALAERIYQLERREGVSETERTRLAGQVLARLQGIEARQEAQERADATALRSMLDRVALLESSRDIAEARRLEGQNAILARLAGLEARVDHVPASPQP